MCQVLRLQQGAGPNLHSRTKMNIKQNPFDMESDVIGCIPAMGQTALNQTQSKYGTSGKPHGCSVRRSGKIDVVGPANHSSRI